MNAHIVNLKRVYKCYFLLLLIILILACGMSLYQQTWGLNGRYYLNLQWEGNPVLTRNDPTPYLKGDMGYHLTGADAYSVKWSGWILIPHPGKYRFATISDDGSFLWLNKTLSIDNGGPHGLQRVSTEMVLEQGVYPIEIAYFQIGGYSAMRTRWAPPGESETQISAEVLFRNHPHRIDVFLRKTVLAAHSFFIAHWGVITLGIGILGIFPLLPYQRIVVTWQPWHSILLWSAGFFLAGAFLIRSGSTYVAVTNDQRPAWRVEANSNIADAQFAIDRWPDTAWTTDQRMHPKMFFQVDLGQLVPIGKIVLAHGEFFEHYPRGYRLEVSEDGMRWATLPILDSRRTVSKNIEIFVSARRARYLKILQTGQSYVPWSIQELSLYTPAWIPHPYQSPLFIAFLAGLVWAAACLGVSLWFPSQRPEKLILSGLMIVVLIGFGLRMFMIRYHDLNVDEKQYLYEALSYPDSDVEWARHTLNKDHRMTALLYVYITRWVFKLCHISSLSIRLMSVLLGTLTIPLAFYVWRQTSTSREKSFEALLAAALIATNILHVCWSRDGHSQVQMALFYLAYIALASHALRPTVHPQRLFWGSGLLLFLGFFLHGSMLAAPLGIVIFIGLDMLMTHWRISDWPPVAVKNYLPVLLSALLFGGYVYYVLTSAGGFADAERYAQTAGYKGGTAISYFAHFLQTRWTLIVANLYDPDLLRDYDLTSPWFLPICGLMLIGLIDVVSRRQKAEWLLLFQPVIFGLIISSLWTTSKFERFLLPVVFSMSVFAARGVSVVAARVKKPGLRWLLRSSISLLMIVVFSVSTVYRIFLEQPPYTRQGSWAYQVYSGKHTSLMWLVQYVKQNPRDEKSILMCRDSDPWVVQHYLNMFTIPISFLDSTAIKELIEEKHIFPAFIIVTQADDQKLIALIERHYQAVGPTASYWQLYELQGERHAGGDAPMPKYWVSSR